MIHCLAAGFGERAAISLLPPLSLGVLVEKKGPGAATKMPGAAASYLGGAHLGLLPRCLRLLVNIWGAGHLGLLPRCLGLRLAI